MVRHHMGLRPCLGVIVGAVALTAAAGCASGGSHASTAGSPATGSTSSSASGSSASATAPSVATSSAAVDQNSPQAQTAIATYRAMWADVVKVEATMNDQDMTLTNHLTGGALTYFHQSIHINKLDGYVAKGEPKLLHPSVKQIVGTGDSTKVLVEDCVDDSGFNLYTTDGTYVHNGHPGGRRLTQALVEQSSGTLMVSTFAYSATGTC